MIEERLTRLASLRGDPAKGIPVSAWSTNLDDLDRDLLLRAAIHVTRTLMIPEWESKRAEDRRPQLALEAAESWLATKSPDAIANAKLTAKECTAARNETFGTDHRIPEAARACAWAVGAKDNAHIWDGLQSIEEDLLARIALVAEYHRVPEVQESILAALRTVLAPTNTAAAPTSSGPVPYAASGHFEVGQQLTHPKFGNLVVTASVDKTIDVQLDDGTTKRLAQKPK